MNEDLKPGARLPLDSITPSRAFLLAQMVALRLRDRLANETDDERGRDAADAIAKQISELEAAWTP
jgi:hypothetical protein